MELTKNLFASGNIGGGNVPNGSVAFHVFRCQRFFVEIQFFGFQLPDDATGNCLGIASIEIGHQHDIVTDSMTHCTDILNISFRGEA